MAKLVFGMNMSLDGYVNHETFAPPGLPIRVVEWDGGPEGRDLDMSGLGVNCAMDCWK